MRCANQKIGFSEQNLLLMLMKRKPMDVNFDIMLDTWNWCILCYSWKTLSI